MASKADHISRQRAAIQRLIEDLDALRALKREYDANGYNHPTSGLLDSDFVGENSDIGTVQFKAAVNGAEEFNTAFTTGATIAANTDKKLYIVIH